MQWRGRWGRLVSLGRPKPLLQRSAWRLSFFWGLRAAALLLVGLALASCAKRPVPGPPIAAISAPPRLVRVTFSYQPASSASAGTVKALCVAGDFNSWSVSANPMLRQGNRWGTSLRLSPGVHQYKFVINHHQWITDPHAAKRVSNGMGGFNSCIDVASPWIKLPPPSANRINPQAISFRPANTREFDVIARHDVRLELLAQTGGLSHLRVILPGSHPVSIGLHVVKSLAGATTWANVIPVHGPTVRYYFQLVHGTDRVFLASGYLYASAQSARAHAYDSSMQSRVVTPHWAKMAVWYEIFPDRFRNGSKANDPGHHIPWRWNWNRPYRPAGEKGNLYSYVYNRFYGGDIQGIQQELPYLRHLGVNALYLTPVFQAPSVHKYDPSSFIHIDDGFGVKGSLAKIKGEHTRNPATWQWSASDKVFLAMVAAAHRQGFKVIIDVPFGHCGVDFPPFQNVLKYGRKSPYAKWFDITSWGPPVQYKAWDKPNGAMPVFARSKRYGLQRGVRNYLFAATRRWLAPDGNVKNGVDGFRLDTAPDVPHRFWIAWRRLVKSINPHALIIGEIWTPAQAWLNRGNQFDGVMNYPFAQAATKYFVDTVNRGGRGLSSRQFASRLSQILGYYPYQVDLVNQNLLDSQDTDRFISRFMNPNLPFNGADRLQDSNPHYNTAKPTATAYTRLKAVVAFQMAFAGAPMIWYGDEVGMWGASDPANRQPMIWKDLQPYDNPALTINTPLLQFYRRAIAARRQLPALQIGSWGRLRVAGHRRVFACYRSLGHDHVYLVVNRSAATVHIKIPVFQFDRGHHLLNYLSPRDCKLLLPPVKDSDARPILVRIRHGLLINAQAKSLRLTLKPWQAMLLARYRRGQFQAGFSH